MLFTALHPVQSGCGPCLHLCGKGRPEQRAVEHELRAADGDIVVKVRICAGVGRQVMAPETAALGVSRDGEVGERLLVLWCGDIVTARHQASGEKSSTVD